MMATRVPTWVLLVVAITYVLAPGAPDAPLSGMPIGQTGIVASVLLIGAWLWTRRQAPAAPGFAVIALAVLALIKIGLGVSTPQVGWLARYYANESFAPPVERSIDFRELQGATRIDRRLSFTDTEFPVHFFNNREYNTGVFREYALPFSVQWNGHVTAIGEQTFAASLIANGHAEVLVDGAVQSSIASSTGQTATGNIAFTVQPGHHVIEVRYRKPPETTPLIQLSFAANSQVSESSITPWETRPSSLDRVGVVTIAAWLIHAAALLIVVFAMAPAIRAELAMRLPIEPAVVGLLLAQGVWKSWHLVGHVWTMSGGDDWLNYEMTGRDGALYGLMMPQGGVIGRGQPFSLYPGYAYFLSFAHMVTGESLAGIILLNFVLLAAATLVAYRIGRHLLGPAAAIGGLVWLVLLEQAAFVRYYTVSLFSENLYFVLAATTVLFLVKHHRDGRIRHLAAAAVAGALASWTRPSMMLLLPFAVLTIVIARWRRDSLGKTILGAVVFGSVWIVTLLPITVRNYLMSGRAVLLTSGQGATFVAYNMPVDDPAYFKGFDGTLFNAAMILTKMFIDHPILSMRNYGTKIGFSLGMVHWMGSGTVHPELIATSLLYFLGIAMLRPMRSLAALPVHAFIATHVATLALTMPSNYGYRMILPAFLFMAIVAGALALTPLVRLCANRSRLLARTIAAGSAS